MNYGENKDLGYPKAAPSQLNIDSIFLALYKRKLFIIFSFVIIFLAGFIYYYITKPVYESTVLLKKQEAPKDQVNVDSYRELVSLQSQDDIQTDVALVKTRSVMDKVINKLDLNLSIDKIEFPHGNTINIKKLLPDYNTWLKNDQLNGKTFPQILNTKIDSLDGIMNLTLFSSADDRYELFKMVNNKSTLIGTYPKSNPFDISTNNLSMTIYWPNVQTGEKLYFTVYDNGSSFKELEKNVTVAQQANTNLIGISVKDRYPETAQLIANTIVNKFLETRNVQQRQNVQWSYEFIDSQLKDVQNKLKTAENNLSNYQSQNGITKIDANSDNLINFLSNLESEKINNDLKLSEYEKKSQEMLNEYKSNGYFDQTYLAPNPTDQSTSPFASLLTQLSNLEVKRIELLQKETVNHPDVVNIENQISQIKKQLSSYNQNTLTAYQIIINTLKEKKSKLENLISQYKSKIQSMPGKETELIGLMRDKDVYEKVFNLLLNKREEMRIKEVSQLQDILIADPANLPADPISPKRLIILAVCLFLWIDSIIVFVSFGIFHERRLLQLNEIEELLQLPIFSIIPEFSKKLRRQILRSKNINEKLVSLSSNESGVVESYNVLRTKLLFSVRPETKIIMFTSCEEHSGKTTIVANLGQSFAMADKRVLIVDADLKRCTLSDLFDISREVPGLSTVLSNDINKLPIIDLSPVLKNISGSGSLSILPAGNVSENSSKLFHSKKTKILIDALKSSHYDYIFVDTPPVTRVIDPLILGRAIGNSVVIVRHEVTLKESAELGVSELRKSKINIMGVVVNACEIKSSSFRYKYGYGYGYKYAYEPGNYMKA